MTAKNHQTPDQNLTVNSPRWNYVQLAEFLKISPNTLRKWVMERRVPFYKINATVRFSPEKILEWLESQAIEMGGKK